MGSDNDYLTTILIAVFLTFFMVKAVAGEPGYLSAAKQIASNDKAMCIQHAMETNGNVDDCI